MEVVIGFKSSGRLASVRLGRNSETPEYLFGIERWLGTFVGKDGAELTYGDPSRANGVDAFSGATVTGLAVVEIVRGVSVWHQARQGGAFAPAVQGDNTGDEVRVRQAKGGGSAWFAGSGIWRWGPVVALFLLALGVYFFLGSRGHTLWLVVVVGLFGVGWNLQPAWDTVLSFLVLAGPTGATPEIWAWIVGLALTGLLAGPLFCGYVCPAGALSHLLGRIGVGWELPGRLERRLRLVKYLVAIGTLLLLVVSGTRALTSFDPLLFLFRALQAAGSWGAGLFTGGPPVDSRGPAWNVGGGWVTLALVGLFVGSSLVWHRPWCRTLCPLGALVSLFERFPLLQRWTPVRSTKHCHVGVEVGRDLDCVRCNRCSTTQRPPGRSGRRRLSGVLLMSFLLVFAVLGALRVDTLLEGHVSASPDNESSSSSNAQPMSGTQPEGGSRLEGDLTQPLDGSPSSPQNSRPAEESPDRRAPTDGPQLYRKDDKQYPVQRDFEPSWFKSLVEEGRLSDHEADFYVPVPESFRPEP